MRWPPGVIPSQLPNFETEARRLRYQALGKACDEANIPSLLLGHHKADSKETSIMRLIEGYRGEGLRAISTESDIPDCEGIYGAYQSGGRAYITTQNESAKALFAKHGRAEDMLAPIKEYRKQGFEFGGVRIYRPLLTFSKRDLQKILKDGNVPWVEDPTNGDPTISIRNAIRFLIGNKSLPMALTGPSRGLETVAENIRQKSRWRDERADNLFQALDIVSFDARAGSLGFRIPIPTELNRKMGHSQTIEQEHIGARLVRLLLQLVSPHDQISLQSLETATKRMFLEADEALPDHNEKDRPATSFTAAGVHCERIGVSIADPGLKSNKSNEYTWRLSRQPYQQNLPEPECPIPPTYPSLYNPKAKKQWQVTYPEPLWHLWDGRYWIQIINCTAKPLNIRPLTEDRLIRLKARIKAEDHENTKAPAILQKLLKEAAPGLSRFTLPAIVDDEDNVLILPTLDFEVKGLTIEWRVRYRRVIFPDNIKREAVKALPEKELQHVKQPIITSHHQEIIDDRWKEKVTEKAMKRKKKMKKAGLVDWNSIR